MNLKNPKAWIISGYLAASICLTATTALAFHIFTTPVSLPQSVVSVPVAAFSGSDNSLNIPTLDDVPVSRDPFARPVPEVAAVVPKIVPVAPLSGLKLKAVILSLKNGVVLEDGSGGVYFLSEGESASGILVKSISKTAVTVEVNGNKFDLFLGAQ